MPCARPNVKLKFFGLGSSSTELKRTHALFRFFARSAMGAAADEPPPSQMNDMPSLPSQRKEDAAVLVSGRGLPGDGNRRKARSKAARVAQSYEAVPPSCGNCAMFVVRGNFRGMFRPPICGIGGFKVEPAGVCDLWRGTNGDVLDNPRNKETT